MLKRLLLVAAAAACMVLPAAADHNVHDVIKFTTEPIHGTVNEISKGLVYMTLDSGERLVLPQMIVFWATDPKVSLGSLNPGDHLTLLFPEDQMAMLRTFRVMKHDNGVTTLGNYEGVYFIPDSVVAAREDQVWVAAAMLDSDLDNDGILNADDQDIDGDGVRNIRDRFPYDSTRN